MNDKIRICVVDDEEIVCERLKQMLEKAGFTVDALTDSKNALELISKKNIDILITDIKMGKPDGIDLLKYARENSPETQVIIITGFATVETAKKAMKIGAVDFIAKPFRMGELKSLVIKIAEESTKKHIAKFSGDNSDLAGSKTLG